uniref:Zinc finger GRF-type domain-containing protein n=1 Tax=Triticum urartu TaxID=4572 RepID=A0A8R7K0P3_TRIUA
MASSSSSSSRSHYSASRVQGAPVRSPIRYRQGPLDYEPYDPFECRPPKKAAMWFSWSDKNPGRRYRSCYYSRRGGCQYFIWHDDPIDDPILKQLVMDLRDQVWLLERLNSNLHDANEPLHVQPAADSSSP